MIKRTVVATIGALAVATGAAYADTGSVNAQIHNLQMQINQLQNQVAHSGAKGTPMMGGLVSTNPAMTHMMLNNQHGVGQELALLNARKDGKLGMGLTVGGKVQADVIYQHTNTKGVLLNPAFNTGSATIPAFPGVKNASKISLTAVDLQAIAGINNWTTAYVNIYRGNIGVGGSIGLSIPEAYLVFGNLQNNPVFGFVGRKDIDFGQFASVMSYIQPLNRIMFQANGGVAGIGYSDYGFTAVVSAMNGGLESGSVNVASSSQLENLNTTSSGNIQNFALNAGYGSVTDNFHWHIGGGLLRGSIFRNNKGQTNGAWDVNTKMSFANFDVLGEFTRTFNKTLAGSNVSSWQIAGDYNFPMMGHDSVFSLSYSAETGDNSLFAPVAGVALTTTGSTTSVNAQQYAVGLRSEVLKNVSTGVEYAYNRAGSNAAEKYSTVVLDVTAMF